MACLSEVKAINWKDVSRNLQYKDVNRRTIEILQYACILKANCCLKVHNVPFYMATFGIRLHSIFNGSVQTLNVLRHALFLFIFFLLVALGLTPGEELRKLLFDTNEYDPDASPEVETGKTAVEISLEFSLQSLHSLVSEYNIPIPVFSQ